jgi:hypothetical protein
MDKFRFWLTVVPAFFFALKAASVTLKKEERTKTEVSKLQTALAGY